MLGTVLNDIEDAEEPFVESKGLMVLVVVINVKRHDSCTFTD